MNIKMRTITYDEAIEFLLPKHYSGRKPMISIAFGCFVEENLEAVITYGKPASNSLCIGVCGKEFSSKVYELNRVCRTDNLPIPLSQFVAFTLQEVSSKDWIIVSYSDTEMCHHGYLYQACNFIYTGKTPSRTDKYTPNNKHSRHYDKNQPQKFRKVRSSKHRYIMFCASNKKTKKLYQKSLNYNIEPYPKGDNKNYNLGEFLKPNIIPCQN